MPKNHGGLSSLVFLPDGKTVAGGTGSVKVTFNGKAEKPVGAEVILWDVATGKINKNLGSHGETVRWVACSNDGATLASASPANGILKVWDLQRSSLRQTLTIKGQLGSGPQGAGLLCALSPDGKFIATITVTEQKNGGRNERTGDELIIWDAVSGRALWNAKGTRAELLAFTPDSQCIATTSQKVEWEETAQGLRKKTSEELLMAREVATGKELWRSPIKPLPKKLLTVPHRGILALSFKSLTLFDPSTGSKAQELKTKPLLDRAAIVSRDGKQLASMEFMGDRIEWLDLGTGKVTASQKLGRSGGESAISSDLSKAVMNIDLKTQIVTLAPGPVP
jgi:hypothetical protein